MSDRRLADRPRKGALGSRSLCRGVGCRGVCYRGVGTTSDGLPGIMIELVPLPLLNSVPGIGEPGTVIVCGPLADPDTRPAPRDVETLGGASTGEGGAMGA